METQKGKQQQKPQETQTKRNEKKKKGKRVATKRRMNTLNIYGPLSSEINK